MRILVILSFITLQNLPLLGQVFLFSDSSSYSINNPVTSRIGYFDISTCSHSIWNEIFPRNSDLTILPDGEIFGFQYLPPLDSVYSYNYKIVGGAGSTSLLSSLDDEDENENINGLTCDKTGKIYSGGIGISEINFSGQGASINYLGNLPQGMQCLGDLTFQHDKLYMASIGNKLIEVDLQNPLNSIVFMEFSPDIFPIHGLATFNYECDSIATYAIGQKDSLSQVYYLDFENKNLSLVCEVPFPILGVATDTECNPPPYTLLIDLDKDDSSGALDMDFWADTICVPPTNITDLDVRVISCLERIDSLEIVLLDILDIGSEYLESTGSNNIQVISSGATEITLVNLGNADNNDFQNVLQNILYQNDAPNITYGTRQIKFIAYEDGHIGEVSTSYITLSNEILNFDADITEPSCFGLNDGIANLSGKGGLTPYEFEWFDNEITDIKNNLSEGNYHFAITDSKGCLKNDSIYISQPDTLIAEIVYVGFLEICDSSANLNTIVEGGTEPYNYIWSTGNNNSEIQNLPSGNYILTVVDDNDCEAGSEITIEQGDTILIQQFEVLCEGETFLFQGNEFTKDTSFCLIEPQDGGCDSTYCLELQFLDTILTNLNEEICQGDSYNFEGNIITSDSMICITEIGINGCDSTVCLTVDVIEFSTPISDSFCEGDTYLFGSKTLIQGGIYFDTLQSTNGCDSILVLNLEELPSPNISFSTNGNLCDGNLVDLSVNEHSAYLWSTGSQNQSISINTSGEYFLTITDDNGCQNSDSFEVIENDLEISISSFGPSCSGQTDGRIIIDVNGGFPPYVYSINNQPAQTENTFLNLNDGVYELMVEDTEGCQSVLSITLNPPTEISLELPEDETIKLGEEIALSALTNLSNPNVIWTPSNGLNCDTCLQVIASPFETTTYTVTIFDSNNCSVSESISIIVNNTGSIYIPNAFSPNGDGINDRLVIYSDASVEQINSFKIFNRWGSLVFESNNAQTNDSSEGWNGQFNGQLLSSGVYIYLAEIQKLDGSIEVLSGEVVLVR